jgi:hypothetical protein
MFGASLLSGAASLPLHLMPLVVAILSSQGRLGVVQAGWIASAYMVGQLVGTLALPGLRFSRLSKAQAGVAAATILAALAWSSLLAGAALVLPWLVVGLACGALQFLGASTAAAAPDRASAFAMRLGTALLVSGIAITALQLADGFASYSSLVVALGVFFLVLLAVGIALYRQPDAGASTQATPVAAGKAKSGLVLVFLLFLGQTGFWAYAVQQVGQSGVSLSHGAYAIALCKATAGVFLLARRTRNKGGPDVLVPGLVVLCAVLLMATAWNAIAFVAGLLAWELAFNLLSARVQALVSQHNPAYVGRWLTAAVFLGAAAGPAIHGIAISANAGWLFIAFACASAVFPWLWLWLWLLAGRRRQVRPAGAAAFPSSGPAQ